MLEIEKRMAEAPLVWCPRVVIFVRWMGLLQLRGNWTPTEVTKLTHEVMDALGLAERWPGPYLRY